MSTLLLSHPACLNHLTPAGHPERPDRLRAIEQALEDEKFQSLARVEAPLGSVDTIALCHPMDYIEAIRDASPKEGLVRLDADTAMSRSRWRKAGCGRSHGGQRCERFRCDAPARSSHRNRPADGLLPI
jgi:acetoin utilization deacetylase AcuC-like enzyme